MKNFVIQIMCTYGFVICEQVYMLVCKCMCIQSLIRAIFTQDISFTSKWVNVHILKICFIANVSHTKFVSLIRNR